MAVAVLMRDQEVAVPGRHTAAHIGSAEQIGMTALERRQALERSRAGGTFHDAADPAGAPSRDPARCPYP
jgi:hypothetical protein